MRLCVWGRLRGHPRRFHGAVSQRAASLTRQSKHRRTTDHSHAIATHVDVSMLLDGLACATYTVYIIISRRREPRRGIVCPHVLMLTPHTNRVVALYLDTWLVSAVDRRWHPLQAARGSFIERSAVHTGTYPSSRRLGRTGQPQPRRVGRNTRMPSMHSLRHCCWRVHAGCVHEGRWVDGGHAVQHRRPTLWQPPGILRSQ